MPINDFIDHLQYQKRYSDHTLKAYTNDLSDFCSFLKLEKDIDPEGQDDWGDVTHHYVREWVLELMNKELSPKTVSRKLSSL